MKAQGDKAFDPLIDLIKRGSPFEKGAALSALASTTDAAIAAKLRDMAIAEESPFTGRQSNRLVTGLLSSKLHRNDTWDWFKNNFSTFVKLKVPDVRLGGMPGFAGGFCSLQRRNEVETFFNQHAGIIPGYERSLKQTLERIQLCIALKKEKEDELKASLSER